MIGVYIHVPFCKNICSYCDFCKMYYNDKMVDEYLLALDKEITSRYLKDVVDTIYIGGGTPSCLNIEQLKKLFNILNKLNKSEQLEYTIEANPETVDLDKIKLFRECGINRVSIGMQSIKDDNIVLLERNHTKEEIIDVVDKFKEVGINSINIDLMYAFKNQSIKDLKKDLDFIIDLDVDHVSTYSLMIEPHTKLYINGYKNISEETDRNMYDYIVKYLKDHHFNHYEISNFCKAGYESRHNLKYWNNEKYYGFGIGASGYIGNIRYDNTKSFNKYINGLYVYNETNIDRQINIENEFMLGLRKMNGINKQNFFNKYHISINNIQLVRDMIKNNKIIDDGKNIFINPDYIYTSNMILVDFIGGNYE